MRGGALSVYLLWLRKAWLTGRGRHVRRFASVLLSRLLMPSTAGDLASRALRCFRIRPPRPLACASFLVKSEPMRARAGAKAPGPRPGPRATARGPRRVLPSGTRRDPRSGRLAPHRRTTRRPGRRPVSPQSFRSGRPPARHRPCLAPAGPFARAPPGRRGGGLPPRLARFPLGFARFRLACRFPLACRFRLAWRFPSGLAVPLGPGRFLRPVPAWRPRPASARDPPSPPLALAGPGRCPRSVPVPAVPLGLAAGRQGPDWNPLVPQPGGPAGSPHEVPARVPSCRPLSRQPVRPAVPRPTEI